VAVHVHACGFRRRLAVLTVALALVSSGAPAGEPRSATETRLEAAITGRVNAIRREHGRLPLRSNPALVDLARDHSRRMSRERFFAHEAPGGDTVADRLQAAGLGYRALGENIARSLNAPDPAAAAVEGWMASDGHRKNILREAFTETGVGVWRDGQTVHVTQIFRRP
jgi:uncharacterized protein YkwD